MLALQNAIAKHSRIYNELSSMSPETSRQMVMHQAKLMEHCWSLSFRIGVETEEDRQSFTG